MLLRQLRALLLPVVVAGIVPWALAAREGSPVRWPPSLAPAVLSLLLLAGGLSLLVGCIRLFATRGDGTLVPWDPPQRLVARGVYRHVRNPMISGVFVIILAEALALASSAIAVWFAVVVVVNLIYIPLSEEPGLERRFGDDYRAYRRNVPRWIPRLTPWQGPAGEQSE